jgi:hypothetical protein
LKDARRHGLFQAQALGRVVAIWTVVLAGRQVVVWFAATVRPLPRSLELALLAGMDRASAC